METAYAYDGQTIDSDYKQADDEPDLNNPRNRKEEFPTDYTLQIVLPQPAASINETSNVREFLAAAKETRASMK